MEMLVKRYTSDEETTLSTIDVDAKFVCFGLEDEFRTKKVSGETRIPAGRYKVVARKEGRHYTAYTKLWKWHRGALHITSVPGFQFIMIHIGNTDKDTEGCLLVGSRVVAVPGKMRLLNSREAYERLYKFVVDSAERGDLFITFLDNDNPIHK